MRSKPIVVALAALLIGCSGSSEPQPLEIGMRAPGDSFTPFNENDSVPVVLGANGLNMIVPSLRAVEIDPIGPDPSVEVSVGGILMAADIEGARVDMVADSVGYVLFDLRVPFQTELCCYNCSPGRVTAVIKDASGTTFAGSVTLTLERASCPDPGVCCQDADACPDPSLTKVCE